MPSRPIGAWTGVERVDSSRRRAATARDAVHCSGEWDLSSGSESLCLSALMVTTTVLPRARQPRSIEGHRDLNAPSKPRWPATSGAACRRGSRPCMRACNRVRPPCAIPRYILGPYMYSSAERRVERAVAGASTSTVHSIHNVVYGCCMRRGWRRCVHTMYPNGLR